MRSPRPSLGSLLPVPRGARLPALLLLLLLAALPAAPALAQLTVDAGPDVVLDCEDENGASYTLNGTVSDGASVTFAWSTAPEVALEDADTLTPTGEFPLGTTTVTLSAESGALTASDSATVTVEDDEPPVVRAFADPMVLWPPNHEMRRVIVTIRARDACTARTDLEVELVSAESDEPDDGRGDGNTRNDIQQVSIGEDDRQVLLRAERQGGGDGRVYTLRYRVRDASGNETETEARVYVPHDYRDVKELLGDEFDGDPDDLEPICPRPDVAAEEFVDAVPRIASYPDAGSCREACGIWIRGCRGIVSGTTRCVASELRSVGLLQNAECQIEPAGSNGRECRSEAGRESRDALQQLRQAARLGAGTCDSIGQRCTNACDDLFDPNGDAYDDEGTNEP